MNDKSDSSTEGVDSVLTIEEPAINSVKKISWLRFLYAFLLAGLVLFLLAYWCVTDLNRPTKRFPLNEPITIEEGTGVRAITEILKRERVVRSDTLLYFVLVLFYDSTSIKASTYVFDTPLTTMEVARRLTEGDFDTNLVRLTHIEGERVSVIAKRAAAILPGFDEEEFVALATPYEGRLFPETYFVPVSYTEKDLLELMLATFDDVTAGLMIGVASGTMSLDETLILASIIEREANSPASMKMVSGILQNRLARGMPLQADASIEYVLDKPLSKLTPEDLELESPYNTYKNVGLPPTPIGNPGLEAIKAVLEPTESDYYYYITDEAGEFYYAKTYAEHQLNIEKYLR